MLAHAFSSRNPMLSCWRNCGSNPGTAGHKKDAPAFFYPEPISYICSMRIKVIYGENASDITDSVNNWLAEYEEKVTVISISPAMPREKDGAYITIVFEDPNKIFNVVVKSEE